MIKPKKKILKIINMIVELLPVFRIADLFWAPSGTKQLSLQQHENLIRLVLFCLSTIDFFKPQVDLAEQEYNVRNIRQLSINDF